MNCLVFSAAIYSLFQILIISETVVAIVVSNDALDKFQEFKYRRFRYVVFFIKNESSIDVEVVGPRDASYDAFLEDLQKGGSGECRYGVFEHIFKTETSKKEFMFLMLWCPGTANGRKKMLYFSNLEYLKQSLNGVHIVVAATDAEEASLKTVEEKLTKPY